MRNPVSVLIAFFYFAISQCHVHPHLNYQCFIRVNNGLYSINAYRNRSFSSLGTFQNKSLNVSNGWDVPSNRCTVLNCLPPIPTLTKITTSETKLGVACKGTTYTKIFLIAWSHVARYKKPNITYFGLIFPPTRKKAAISFEKIISHELNDKTEHFFLNIFNL